MDRKTQITSAIIKVVSHNLKKYLANKFKGLMGEAASDEFAEKFISGLISCLQNDYDLQGLIVENDVVDQKGNVNGPAVIAGLEAMADNFPPNKAQQIKHLAANMKTVFTNLHLLPKEANANAHRNEPDKKNQRKRPEDYMKYPCIVYQLDERHEEFANGIRYRVHDIDDNKLYFKDKNRMYEVLAQHGFNPIYPAQMEKLRTAMKKLRKKRNK
jgi:hypothetical protein